MKSIFEKLTIVSIVIVVVVVIALGICWRGLIGHNDDQNWQISQSISGDVEIIDQPGYYKRFFSDIWTYPRFQEAYFSESAKEGGPEDDSIGVTFNDGGNAWISAFVRYTLPIDAEKRRELHRAFASNPENIKMAVRSALIDCCKNTAPLMSASEHQSARKAEFKQLVEEQMMKGIYESRKVEKTYKDKTDEAGKPITIYVTEIITDKDGKPIISQPSPLTQYGLTIKQFSITGTKYDDQTLKQFAAKKDAFLKAELSKSQREEEVQKRLQVIEKGKREVAEMEAKMNVERTQAIVKAEKEKEMAEIAAQQKVEVEKQAKLEAVTRMEKELAIKEMDKKIAETKATQELEVAKIERQAALEEAQKMIEIAKAKQKQIELSGAITEEKRILAEIEAKKAVEIAKALSEGIGKAKWPTNVIMGSGNEKGNGASVQDHLMKLIMLNLATGQPVQPIHK